MINYSDKETKTMLEDFDKIVNDPSLIIPDMSIEKALYIMETYINYGVIDQANSVATEPNIENRTFDFTVPIQEGKVLGSDLKGIFQDFAVNLLTTMRGKAIPLSDMYVKDITPTYVTFGLDIMPLKIPPHQNLRYYFPEFYQSGDEIDVPSNVNSPWTDWFNNEHTYWEPWPNPENGNEVTEYNVYRYSQKPVHLRYNDGVYFTYYTGIYIPNSEIYFTKQQTRVVDTIFDFYQSPINYDAIGIKDILIPATLAKLPDVLDFARYFINVGERVICDYLPALYYESVYQGNPLPAFHLFIKQITIGYKHIEQPQMRYVSALTIADIYPEL